MISFGVLESNFQKNIHQRFDVDIILLAIEKLLPSQAIYDNDEGPIISVKGREEYLINEIIRRRTRKVERQALVKWTGNLKLE